MEHPTPADRLPTLPTVASRLFLATGLLPCLLGFGCAQLAQWTAPDKIAATERTPLALQADDRFWRALHGGSYGDIPEVLEDLTAAYLEDPGDAVTAAHLGFAHIWRLSERSRLEHLPATITDHAVLGRKYFAESHRLDDSDARVHGFLGSLQLVEASLHEDEKLRRRGYYTLMDSVDAWSEFNLFTAGYAMSSLPFDSPRFEEALDFQWRTLDECSGTRIDRRRPSYSEFMDQETHLGVKRVCWNSWIAPHNFEGFFLNMGDMLVKSGDPGLAVEIYGMAKLSRDYARWPYRHVLEGRIANAHANVEFFRDPTPSREQPRTMVASSFACTGCHQKQGGFVAEVPRWRH